MIGLCINYYNKNYGGLLQAYATTKILEELGVNYEIIRYNKKVFFLKKIKQVPRIFNKILINDKKELLKKKIGATIHKDFKRNKRIRDNEFDFFCKEKFVKMSPIYKSYVDLMNNSNKYSIVMVGSDQLWSPAGLPTNFYNLNFCKNGVKRISYASSFGVSYIPWYQKKRTKDYLLKMDCISMRENKGAELVKDLTNLDVPVVLDPVFLLSREKWDNYIPNKSDFGFKYVFAYFLGNNSSYRDEVTKFAKNNNLKVITLRHLDQYIKSDEKFGDYAPYKIGPSDFLNLIRNAEYVFTDSFHGSVFSIIYHKLFLTFNRYSNTSKVSKNSRINTLMTNLGINRVYSGDIESIKNEINYDLVDITLEEFKKKSFDYLKDALEV